VLLHCLAQEFVYFSSRFQEAAIFPVNDSKHSVRLTLYSVINFPFVFEFLYWIFHKQTNVYFEVNALVTQTYDAAAAPFLNRSFLSKFYVAEDIFLCLSLTSCIYW